MTERLAVTVDRAARLLGISRGLAYEMVRAGKIPSIKLGKRILISKEALQEWLRNSSGGKGSISND